MMETANKRVFASRDEWLQSRNDWVGASEVAGLVLRDDERPQWMPGPYGLWARKRGIMPPPDENALMRWGLRLENAIADEAADRLADDGFSVVKPEDVSVWMHPQCQRLAATPDRLLVRENDECVGVLEIKTARSATGWEDGPPLAYQVQTQAQMACVGVPMAYIAVLIGGSDFRLIGPLARNQRFNEAMIAAVTNFWAFVESGDPPPVDGSDDTSRAIQATYPQDDGGTVVLGPEFMEIDERLLELKRKIEEMTEEKNTLENRIKAAIGDAKYGILPHCRYSYSTVKTEEKMIVKKATTYRVLRRAARE